MTSPRGTRNEVPAGRKPLFLPPKPRGAGPGPTPRIKALDPAKPALRLLTIGMLTLLGSLLAIGIAWAVAL